MRFKNIIPLCLTITGILVHHVSHASNFLNAYTKGRIEFVLPIEIQNDTNLINFILTCSEESLTELERNLTYKTSDRVHLIGFVNYGGFFQYSKRTTKTLKGTQFEYHSGINQVYSPILITGNQIDLEVQIRKSIAQQFLQEFLHGYTYAERFNIQENEGIPIWLKNGFIAYFSEGINKDEFMRFQYLLNQRSFRNLNFIDKKHHLLFGKAIWYLIESEKGKNQNSVFWSFLKHAQSFENTFEFHFGLTFKKWYSQKINQLRISKTETFRVNYQLKDEANAWNKSYFYSHQPSQTLIHQTVNQFSENAYLIDLQNNISKKIRSFNSAAENPFPEFKTLSFYRNNSKAISNWDMIFWDSSWKIRRNNNLIELGKLGRFTLIYSDHSRFHLIEENNFKTYYRIIALDSPQFNSKIELALNGGRLSDVQIEILPNQNFKLNGILTVKRNKSYINSVITSPFPFENIHEVYRDSVLSKSHSISDQIIIDSLRFSFVSHQPIESAIYVLDSHLLGGNSSKINTKGILFSQQLFGKDSIIEFFIANNQWNINIYEKTAPVSIQDTFQPNIKWLDTIQKEKTDTYEVLINSIDTGKFFVSTFLNKPKINKSFIRSYHEKKKWDLKSFESWFYFREHHFYFDNRDFDLPYSGAVSPEDQYNGPLLFNYRFSFFDALSNSGTQISAYSNINRRKIGFEIKHRFLNTKDISNDIVFQYRLRQFSNLNLTADRNRNIGVKYQVEFDHGSSNLSFLKFDFYHSQIIALNTQFEKSITTSNYSQYLRLSGGFNTQKVHVEDDFFQWNYLFSNYVELGTMKFDQELRWLGNINSELKSYGNWGIFKWKYALKGKYSLSPFNITHILGGTEGWISNDANNNDYYQLLERQQKIFLHGNLPLRGVHFGSRMGQSYFTQQFDFGLPMLRLFPYRFKEKQFWRSFMVYGFFDAGMTFYGTTPGAPQNPYNTISISSPNYILTVSSHQNPWILSYGIGLQTSILGYPFRFEYSQGKTGNLQRLPFFQISIGKNL